MFELKAPNYLSSEQWDEVATKKNSCFLGGGITDCPDWQAEMVNKLSDTDITLFNPRQDNFDVNNLDASRSQIIWEHYHLLHAKRRIFWFPEETLCPITLFELGKWLRYPHRLLVGCHPNYARKFDVEYQIFLDNPTRRESYNYIQVVESLDDLAEQAKNWIKSLD